MGFFDKMFEKKECAICGTELGLLGKTKINEGYLCKECAGKLSPYFHGYRSSTADDIREQLAYREANAERLASFNPTRTLSAGRINIMPRRRRGSAESLPRRAAGATPIPTSSSSHRCSAAIWISTSIAPRSIARPKMASARATTRRATTWITTLT